MWNSINVWFARCKKSWTVQFNFWLGLLLIFWPDIVNNVSMIQPYVPENMYKILNMVLIIGNVLIRVFRTKAAFKDK